MLIVIMGVGNEQNNIQFLKRKRYDRMINIDLYISFQKGRNHDRIKEIITDNEKDGTH